MTASKIFLYFCLSFIAGIFIGSMLGVLPGSEVYLLLPGLILGILLISVFWKYKKFVVIGFCLLFLVLGIWRHQQVELGITNNELRKYDDSGKTITLLGMVVAEPDIREKTQKLTIKATEISLAENSSLPVSARVLVTIWKYPEYQYGDKLKITGKIELPKELEDFNYPGYLAKDGIYSVIYWPKIELLEKETPHNFFVEGYAKILQFKEKLKESIYQNLSPPQSSILGALILGDKRQISEDLKQKLNVAGVRHITAVSGLHVAILTSILMTLLIGFGLWRQQAFWFSIILITLFIIMTGLQPSAIRAGIMGGLFLLAQYLGRMNTSSRTIVFAAALMLAQNPLLLKFDVGFQLSFLAMMGIIYFLPIFQDILRKIPNFLQLRSLLAMTLSAQIFTLPILIYNFGYFSLVSPVTNILIVPFLPYIMGLGFAFGIAGLIFQPLGWLFSLPCWLLLTYLIKIVGFFSQPWTFKLLEISWIWLIISYLILGLITWRLQKNQKFKFLNY